MSIARINIPLIDRQSHIFQSSGHHPKTEALSFKALLDKTASKETEGSLNDMRPLSEAQIINFLREIQTHLDTQLMRALSLDKTEEAETQTLPLMGLLPSPEIEASNKRHTTPKKDDSNGRTNLNAVIDEAAKTHGVDEALVQSVIKVESNYNSAVTSSKGAMGLMQLMPGTARELGVENAYDPVENIGAGTRYLKMLLNRYDGNVPLALAAYNWGMGNLERRPSQMPVETRQYVDKVMRHYEKLKA